MLENICYYDKFLNRDFFWRLLIDLKMRAHSNYEDVATAISGESVGFFIGSALGGLLVDKLVL